MHLILLVITVWGISIENIDRDVSVRLVILVLSEHNVGLYFFKVVVSVETTRILLAVRLEGTLGTRIHQHFRVLSQLCHHWSHLLGLLRGEVLVIDSTKFLQVAVLQLAVSLSAAEGSRLVCWRLIRGL